MNRIHQLIWNKTLNIWVVVSEHAKSSKKRSGAGCAVRTRIILTTALSLYTSTSHALPTGNELIAGQASVSTPSAQHLQINQSSQNAIINWQGFSVQNNESVNIQQPNANAALLNRVVGQDASNIQGKINANGQVYLVNPNGVVFSKTAQVDVGSLIASTHQITNQDFLNGKLHFTQDNAKASVVNNGQIKTPAGGVVALIGEQVENNGSINTPKGTTALAAGKTVDLDMKGDGLVEVKITDAALNAQIKNNGILQADGGQVIMTAKAAGQLLNTVINNGGVIEAKGLVERNGKIVLSGGDNGVVQVGGSLNASGNSAGGQGGQIAVTGDKIVVDSSAKLNASGNTGGGTIQVGSNTGNQTSSATTIEDGATLNAQSTDSGQAGSIKVFADMQKGQLNVKGTIDASAPKTGNGGAIETSAAQLKIADTAKITTAAANGKVGTWIIDPTDFTIAATGGDMTGATLTASLNNGNVSILSTSGASGVNGDVNVNDVVSWSAHLLTLNAQRNININANLNGSGTAQLALLYGQASTSAVASDNYFINGATVNLPAGANFSTQNGSSDTVNNYTVITSLGAAGSTTATDLQGMNGNLNLNYALGGNIDASATSGWNSGAGFLPVGTNTTPFTGNFDGLGHTISGLSINLITSNNVGLFGYTGAGSTINNLGLQGINIAGDTNVGGLAGFNSSTLNNINTSGSVTGSENVGGLVGYNSNSTINNSFSTNNITGSVSLGGLVGNNNSGNISNAYATGNIFNGSNYVGGLVGYNDNNGSINNAYATGSVSGTNWVGGLVGNNVSGTINSTYATGNVNGFNSVGGLVGVNNGIINNSFWDTQTTGQSNSVGIGSSAGTTGINSLAAITQTTYTNAAWDFTSTWWMSDGNTRPFLQKEYSTNITNSHQLQLMAMNLNANYTLANNIDLTMDLAAVNGQYSGMWGSSGFVPTGNATTPFMGNFDGLGHTITGLTINRPTTDDVGLFGAVGYTSTGSTVYGSTINNVGLVNGIISGSIGVGELLGAGNAYNVISNAYTTGSVNGSSYVGGLVGNAGGSGSSISNSYSMSNVSGISYIGGLAGSFSFGSINNVYATGNVTGSGDYVGGLAGFLDGASCPGCSLGSISNAYATGNVTGSNQVGGLVGDDSFAGIINNSYATGTVNGLNNVGGLVGDAFVSTISNTYATGSVNGATNIGGLVGVSDNNSSINNSYATGSVNGSSGVGGLVGNNYNSTISDAYATGTVSGSSNVGGLVGYNFTGSIINSFWDTQSTGQSNGVGSGSNIGTTGKTTTEIKQPGTFTGWSISSTAGSNATWRIYEGYTSPLLSSFLTPLTITADNINKTYNGISDSSLSNASYSISGADSSGHLFNIANPYNNAINVGSYNASGVYSDQQGYDIALTNGVLTINPATLTYTATGSSRAYGVSNPGFTGTITGFVNNETQATATTGTASFNSSATSSSNVDTYAINGSGLNANNGNYVFVQADTNATALRITPATLIYTATGNSRTYGSNNPDFTGIITGFVNNETQATATTGTASFNSSATSSSNVDTYAINGSGLNANNGNYVFVQADTNATALRITPATLIYTATGNSRTYGSSNPDFTGIITGFVNNETQATATTGTASFSSSVTSSSNVGNYAITGSGLTAKNGNYNFTQSLNNANALSITPASLIITAIPVSKTYDSIAYLGGNGVTYSGLVNNEKSSILTGKLKYIGNSQGAVNAGINYNIIPCGLSSANYTITYVNGVLSIQPAALSLTSSDASKTYDGNTTANGVVLIAKGNLFGSDTLSGGSFKFADANVGINKTVSLSDVLIKDGNGGNNYQLEYIDNTHSQIDLAASTISNNLTPLIAQVATNNSMVSTLFTTTLNTSITFTPNNPAPTQVSVNDSSDSFPSTPASPASPASTTNGLNVPGRILPPPPIDKNRIIIPSLKIKKSAGRIKQLLASNNKQFLSLLLDDGSVRVWDFQTGVQRHIDTKDSKQALIEIGSVDENKRLLSIANKAGINAYDIITSQTDEHLTLNEANIKHFVTSNDGKIFLVNTGNNQLNAWDSQQNKMLWQSPLILERGVVSNLALSDNNRYAAVLSTQSGAFALNSDSQLQAITDAVDIVDLGTGKILKSLPGAGESVIYMQFKDGDTLQTGLASGEVFNWSIKTGSKKSVANFTETVTSIDSNKQTYAYLLKDGTVRIGDGQGHIKLDIHNEQNPFQDVTLLADGKKLLTVMETGELSVWDVTSGKKMLRLFSTQQGWTVMDSFGRFDTSEDSLNNFTWLADEENIPLNSFSENYYEPGLLSTTLQDKEYFNTTINEIRKGISLPPKLTAQLAEQQASDKNVAVQLDVYDRGGGIDKVNIYHNGKIVSNEKVVVAEQTLQESGLEHRILSLKLTPTAGKNTLKAIANNDMGIENTSTELKFDGEAKAYSSKIRLVTIGIDHYSDQQLDLAYSVADADLLNKALIKSSPVSGDKKLYNEKATKPRILAELKALSQDRVQQQDVLVIYFAGHGIAVGKEWYFLPYETKMQSSPEQLIASGAGISATELSDIFKDSKIQHIMLMVDACYSGAGMDAFRKLENSQRYFTRKLSRTLGITVVAAAEKDQQAFELQTLGHGLFTYAMNLEIEKNISVHRIAQNIVKTLPFLAKDMLGTNQEPVAFSNGSDFMLTDPLKNPLDDTSIKNPLAVDLFRKPQH